MSILSLILWCSCWTSPLFSVLVEDCRDCRGYGVFPCKFEMVQNSCYLGPDVKVLGLSTCWNADLTKDGDIDLEDIAIFQRGEFDYP